MGKKLRILLGPFIISWAPIFFVLAGAGMSPGSVAGWRFLLAGIFLAIYQLIRDKKLAPLNVWMLIGAITFAADLYLWHHAILSIGSGLATVLTNTQVIYMSFISLAKKEYRRPSLVIGSALVGLAGVFCLFYERIFSPDSLGSALPLLARVQGLIFGLIAGMLYTVFLLCFSRAQNFNQQTRRNGVSALQTLTWVSLVGGAGILIFELILARLGLRFANEIYPHTAHQIFWVLALAVFVHIGGWVEIGNAINHYKKATMGLILLLQPVMATIWAWLLFGDRLNGMQFVGAALIFVALMTIRLAESLDLKARAA